MRLDFQQHITDKFPFLATSRLLLAVSGGLDSMVMLELCRSLDIAVAHCNFHLRGAESDGDEQFVKDYCLKYDIPYFSKRFDTLAFAKMSNISTQMAARDLRYGFFEELSITKGFDYIITAHHLNDEVETFIINLSRGTGIEGLKGIPSVNGKICRVLLPFSRKRIENFARSEGVQWREDSSNASIKYTRNAIRHNVVPALEEVRSDFLQRFASTQSHLKQTAALLKVYTEQLRLQLCYPIENSLGPDGMAVDLEKLRDYPEPEAALYSLLGGYGFTAWEDIYSLPDAQSGKQVTSATHRVFKNRNTLQVFPLTETDGVTYIWETGVDIIKGNFGTLTISQNSGDQITSKNEMILDAQKMEFPLTIRRWEEGDYFYPFGMKGKKKVSKYLKDEKLSLIAKENVWLLCHKEDIVWVVGHRADDRFKVTPKTSETIKITRSYDGQNV